jgi:predicted SnoaL-like aldol condensation-catalyzing enzyme
MISYADSEDHAARTAVTRAVITDFARLFYVERHVRTAFETFVAPGYIQHNPGIPDGRDAAIAALAPMFSDPEFHADLKRVLADGDYGVIHLHGYHGDQRGGAVMDLYRVADGKIVEHWDVIQPIPETAHNDHPLL